ncbi:hypothetical protein [Piscinibacter sp. XHJ-5]|uniref:hypothetical protein n=1 Tax=Piscinibacter sp. XHJ-5 TaxID=3037797 RepID=UPI002452F461|nr:hypothetical protein [Piscinibacter sp. XHJ-5]
MIVIKSKSASIVGIACLLFVSGSYAGTFSTIARRDPTHLVASTGNLYWTSYVINEFGPSTASIWRTSKNAKPGEERLLYSEVTTGYKPFGNIAYANVGDWYGYFIANDQSASHPVNYSSSIKRVPLAGGNAVTIATLTRFVGNRSLRTDGAHLYWVDTDGIRRMPISGGAVATLATTTLGRHLELGTNFVYYSDGSNIRRVLKTGGSSSVMVSSAEPISALYIHPIGNGTRIFWGEESGGVYARNVGSTSTTTYKGATSGYRTSSVGFDGTRVLWTTCTDSGNGCSVGIHDVVSRSTIYNVGVGLGRVGFDNLQWDATQVIWGDVGGVYKYAY